MSLFVLKIIALVSMTVDHAFKALPLYSILGGLIAQKPLYLLYSLFVTGGGRIAFPIFAFTVANGCKRTSDRRRYLTRLLLFGLLSEPIFYLLHDGGLNVFATLAAAASAVFISARFKRSWQRVLIYLAFAVAAELCGCDYGMFGVAAVALFYELPSLPSAAAAVSTMLTLSYTRSVISGTLSLGSLCFIALGYCAAAVIVSLYNGERGPRVKWLFYIYYPAHLAVLYSIGLFI